MRYSYLAYGLLIQSELELPELMPAPAGVAELTIRRGKVAWQPTQPANPDGCIVEVEVNRISFCWPQAGKFVAQNGREIIFDPITNAEDSLLRILILSAVMSAVLHQRGLLLLHASALCLGDEGVVFMGDKGEGKSTLAASMQLNSFSMFEMVADDRVALTISASESWILPAFPQFRLWPDAIASFGLDSESLIVLHPELKKMAYRAEANFASHPVRLRNVYVLDTGTPASIELLNPKEAFLALARYSYLGRHIRATGLSSQHFKDCSHVANSVPVARLRRPRSLELLADVGALVANDLARGDGLPNTLISHLNSVSRAETVKPGLS